MSVERHLVHGVPEFTLGWSDMTRSVPMRSGATLVNIKLLGPMLEVELNKRRRRENRFVDPCHFFEAETSKGTSSVHFTSTDQASGRVGRFGSKLSTVTLAWAAMIFLVVDIRVVVRTAFL